MKTKFELFRERAFDLLYMGGVAPDQISACQYELILEAGLDHVTDRVRFNPLINGCPDTFITEIRLHMCDIFIANEWGMFILNTTMPTDINFEEHTYPDAEVFGKKDAEELDIFYHSDLSFIVNNLIVLPKVRTDRFKKYKSVIDRRDEGDSGLQDIKETLLVLTGSKNLSIILDLPRKTSWNNSGIRLRLRLGGLLFRNASIIT